MEREAAIRLLEPWSATLRIAAFVIDSRWRKPTAVWCRPNYSPPRGPPTRWSEHRRESLSPFNEPSLLSRVLLSRVEFVQFSLNTITW